LAAVGVTDIDELRGFLSDKKRYEQALAEGRLGIDLIRKIWQEIRLEYRCRLTRRPDTLALDSYRILENLDDVTIPINGRVEAVVAPLMGWLKNKNGRLEILDTLILQPKEFKRRYWQVRKHNISLASWIEFLFLQYGPERSYIGGFAPISPWYRLEVEAFPIGEFMKVDTVARGTFLRLYTVRRENTDSRCIPWGWDSGPFGFGVLPGSATPLSVTFRRERPQPAIRASQGAV
jgi:hypothetical protein